MNKYQITVDITIEASTQYKANLIRNEIESDLLSIMEIVELDVNDPKEMEQYD